MHLSPCLSLVLIKCVQSLDRHPLGSQRVVATVLGWRQGLSLGEMRVCSYLEGANTLLSTFSKSSQAKNNSGKRQGCPERVGWMANIWQQGHWKETGCMRMEMAQRGVGPSPKRQGREKTDKGREKVSPGCSPPGFSELGTCSEQPIPSLVVFLTGPPLCRFSRKVQRGGTCKSCGNFPRPPSE